MTRIMALRPFVLQMIVLTVVLMPLTAFSNALSITNVSYDLATKRVTFNIAWNNSWRTERVPLNWDAAWVFVKFRECGFVNDPWTHGLLSTTLADHTFPSNLEPTTRDGASVNIDPAPHNTGAMLRRTANGYYAAVAPTTVVLNVTNLPAVGTLLDLKVIGIEMVFVPGGQYFIGDNCSRYSFNRTLITSENAISIGNVTHGGDVSNIPALFPKGFNPFYMMKYEISQGQYADFLNTISSNAQSNRFPGNNPGGGNNFRYAIVNTGTPPNIYVANRPDRAMNWISWADFSAYLDWAALRPMTEMEYEKGARGPLPPVACEFAWGSTRIVEATTISTTIPSENGTETIINSPVNGVPPNCNFVDNDFIGGDQGRGPLRVGIFATSATNARESTGAGYYGAMELTGNLWEYVIPAVNSTVSQNFRNVPGDGVLAADGNHNVPEWPAPTTATNTRLNSTISIRGGAWDNIVDWQSWLYTSGRYHIECCGHVTRHQGVGGRGVR